MGQFNNGKYYGLFSKNGMYPDGSGPGALVSSAGGNVGDTTAGYKSILAQAPTAAPDYTDKVLQAARASQAMDSSLKQGRRTTFLSGPEGLGLNPPVGGKTLLGG